MKKKPNSTSLIDFAMGKLSAEESLRVIEELERDPAASAELDDVMDIVNFSAIHGEEVFGGEDATVVTQSPIEKVVYKVREFLQPKRFAYPVAALVFFLVALVATSSLVTDRYYPLTHIERLDFESRVRGPGVEDFAKAYEAFGEGHYDESIRLLERFIRAYPKSELVDYAHYSAGAIYLVSSKRTFISLFPSFDLDRLNRGMEHLELAIRKSSNPRTVENSHWLQAKGYLMSAQPERAIAELQVIASLNGLKRDEAKRLMSEIREIQKGG